MVSMSSALNCPLRLTGSGSRGSPRITVMSGNRRRAARQPTRPARRLAGQEQPVRHHAEILVARAIPAPASA